MKILWHDGLGTSLYAKRRDRGRLAWPSATDGVVACTLIEAHVLAAGRLHGDDATVPMLAKSGPVSAAS